MKPRKSTACKNCIYSGLTYSPVLKALVETCSAGFTDRGEGCKNTRVYYNKEVSHDTDYRRENTAKKKTDVSPFLYIL